MEVSFYQKRISGFITSSDRAKLLYSELQIETVWDLLTFYPYRYVDRSSFHSLVNLTKQDKEVQLLLRLIKVRQVSQRTKRLSVLFGDGTAILECVWFRWGKWLLDMMRPGTEYVLFGKVTVYSGRLTMTHPEMTLYEVFKKKSRPITPVYHTTEKLTKRGFGSKGIEALVYNFFSKYKPRFPEFLPGYLLQKRSLLLFDQALKGVHFPKNHEVLRRAIFRMKFDELFTMQLQVLRQRHADIEREQRGILLSKVGKYTHQIYKEYLPFDLTAAQKRVIREIYRDMKSGKQMNRLLQGDVGSGKTVVALMTMLIALDNGYQACLLAPTEILAHQHFEAIYALLQDIHVSISLLTGSTKSATRRQIYQDLKTGYLKILVGTHAVFEDKVQFNNLAVAIVDEQHRFGVVQRSKLWKKNEIPPHVLVMTATPIPRTLAMTLYGDLDASVIDELPPGRKPVKTHHIYEKHRSRCYSFIQGEIEKGRQAYVVFPLIQESQQMDYLDVERGFQNLTAFFPKYRIAKLHGKMSSEEKEKQMALFVSQKAHILVATTVIEVGVNVPNATVMLLESAERFGLSQLHQLRGRVGRGADLSYCFLITSYKLSKEARIRMKTMCHTHDGFEIADVDLELRGPGDLQGTRQSGLLNFKIANIPQDEKILSMARGDAIVIMEADSQLENLEHQGVKKFLNERLYGKEDWGQIS